MAMIDFKHFNLNDYKIVSNLEGRLINIIFDKAYSRISSFHLRPVAHQLPHSKRSIKCVQQFKRN